MTIETIIELRDAAEAAGDQTTYRTAWVALGHHRHPAFLPATADERAAAIAKLQKMVDV